MTDQMTPEAATALRKPFPASAVGKLPKGGQQLDYVGHAAVTDRLLAVDPGWTWEPMALTPAGLPVLDNAGNLWIRLTVCGVTRIGVGDGKSAKELISDALRNAAMRFGVALDLWSREELEYGGLAFSPPADTHTPPDPDALALQEELALLNPAAADELRAWWTGTARLPAVLELNADQRALVRARIEGLLDPALPVGDVS